MAKAAHCTVCDELDAVDGSVGRSQVTRLLDRSAIGLSALCLVHCLAFPVLIAMLPALAIFLPNQWWVHPVILATALPLAGIALWRGWSQHRELLPPLLGTAGLVLMVAGVLAGENNWSETALTVVGGSMLAFAHLMNWRLGETRRHPAKA